MNDPTTPSDVLPPLPDMIPGSQIETEWNYFRRERLPLLAEGHEGRWVLIKGEAIFGIFDTRDEAVTAGYARFGVVPLLAQQILRVYKTVRAGNYWRCRFHFLTQPLARACRVALLSRGVTAANVP
jgi:hypothetical protein